VIGLPVNDHACLGQITEVITALVRDRDAVIEELADRYDTRTALISWIRSLPQRDDEGDPKDGPKADSCNPPQRIRIPAADPNCVERAALYIAVAEMQNPRTLRQLATVDTPTGPHTFPVECGEPVVLDPTVTRNALRGGLYRNAPAPVEMTPYEAVDWICQIAADAASTFRGGVERMARAREAMRACLMGGGIAIGALDAVALALVLAEREARAYGLTGVLVVETTREVLAELDARAHRNARRGIGLRLGRYEVRPYPGSLGALARIGGRVGSRVGGAALRAFLAAQGVPPSLVDELEGELRREGLTLGSIAAPAPVPGTLAALAADAVKRAA
jgi:hypothetical protein